MTSQPLPAEETEIEADQRDRAAGDADLDDLLAAERRHQRTLRALADVDAFRLIEDDAMQAWADRLGTDHELPVPQPD